MSDPKHEILQDLKRVASDLGRTPSRKEYRSLGRFAEWQLRKHYGGFTLAVSASGLDPVQGKKKTKLTREEIFGRDVREVAPTAKALVRDIPKTGIRILAIGDTHFPWVSQDVLCAIYAFIDALPEAEKPDVIVQVGDLHDCFGFSKYPTSKNVYNPFEEITLAHEMASQMWATLRKLAPKAQLIQTLGNHDVRPLKRVIESCPEVEPFFSIDKFYTFEGVRTHFDTRTPLDLGECVVIHGHRSRSIDHWLDLPGKNIIHGHTHKAALSFKRFGQKTHWIMDVGFAGDPQSKVFGYTPVKTLDMIPAIGWVDHNGPRIILV